MRRCWSDQAVSKRLKAAIAAGALNQMIELGRPEYV
jgi:hypothetical protein